MRHPFLCHMMVIVLLLVDSICWPFSLHTSAGHSLSTLTFAAFSLSVNISFALLFVFRLCLKTFFPWKMMSLSYGNKLYFSVCFRLHLPVLQRGEWLVSEVL